MLASGYRGSERAVRAPTLRKTSPKAGDKAQEAAHRIKESLKNLLVPGVMFEELGFKYYGPIDGHNLQEVVSTLEHLKHQGGPIPLHAVTEKGKGYPFAPTSKVSAICSSKISSIPG